jgi:hypothetical protein
MQWHSTACLSYERRAAPKPCLDCFWYVLIYGSDRVVPETEPHRGLEYSRTLRGNEIELICITVTHSSASPTWLRRQSPHRVYISEIYLYVFVKKYKQKHQMRKNGKFEIRFAEEQGTLSIFSFSMFFMVLRLVCSIVKYFEIIQKGGV